jgi:MFS family permease
MQSLREHEPLVLSAGIPSKENAPSSDTRFSVVLDILHSFPKEVWLIYAVKFLESYSFFILAYSLVLYLSDEFGFGDEQAAWAYGIYGTLVSIYGLAVGVVIDSLGVRMSLMVGLGVLIVSRIVLATTRSPLVIVLALGSTLPLGAALTLPVLQIGIKRYTTDATRSVAFTGFYIVMNLSAMAAAPCIDAFHRVFQRNEYVGPHLTPYRLLIAAGALLSCWSFYISYRYIHCDGGPITTPRRRSESPLDAFKHVLRSRVFWRFTLLAILLLGVRSIYRHLDATFPKYMVRVFGADAPFGSLIALNPLCVVLVSLLSAPYGLKYHPVPMIIFGSFISALSPFVLAIGHTYANAILFILLLSIGEGIWSPRLYEYSVMIAETGREGVYTALAAAPMFLSSLLTGATSGLLLDRYVPDKTEPKQPEIMWTIIGLISVVSPVLMMLFRPIIEQPVGSG